MINSTQNKFIKLVSSLKNKKERLRSGLFVIEGERILSEITPDWEVVYYFATRSFLEKNRDVTKFLDKDNFYLVTEDIFKKISDTVTPQGVLAVCKQKNFSYKEILKKENKFLLLLEEISDPGNLGTIIRTADASGVDAIFLSKGCADLYNSKVIRSTMGSIFHIPIFTDSDFNTLIDEIKSTNTKVVSTDLNTDKSIYSINMKESLAVLIGNEANGISDEILKKSDEIIKIPMIGKVESINASIACGVLLFEVVRQRI